MDQNITLKIAGADFRVKASSPEMESAMRVASEEITKMMERFDQKYPDKTFTDKLLFVSLTQAVYRLQAQNKLNMASAEQAKLEAELKDYLNGIESNR
ncbi:MAG: cell division protein ZapA [Bacteroidales bacterium]|nr:cell division protein ZapA [Bacteroidales bacterium]